MEASHQAQPRPQEPDPAAAGPGQRVRALVFGEVAEVYASARPGYAPELADVVLDFAALGEGRAVEVGAGTGKATAGFAARGVPLLCLEPDPRMARVLRRATAGFPSVRVEVSAFEEWSPQGRYGLLYAATCWHWCDPASRWDRAYTALAPGGTLALCWNVLRVRDAGLHARLAEVDRGFGFTEAPHSLLGGATLGAPGEWGDEEEAWPAGECRADGRFTGPRELRLPGAVTYDTRRYLSYLSTVSAYRLLPEIRRARLFEALAEVLEGRGGGIEFDLLTDVFLARAR